MSKGTVFITGATGFLGSIFLLEALRKGYSAHVVARSPSKAEVVKEFVANHGFSNEAAEGKPHCTYFIVPDLTLPGALDEAVRGTDCVLHCASPLPFAEIPADRQQAEMIDPAIACTLNMLESVRTAGGATVKRVVVLASLIAFASADVMGPAWVPAEGQEVHPNEDTLNDYISPPFANLLIAYCAAKTAALRSSLDWMSSKQAEGTPLGFDLVNLAPAYVVGRHPLARTTADLMATSNSMMLAPIVGRASEPQGPLCVGGAVHVDDLTAICLESLDPAGKVRTPSSGPDRGVANFCISVDVVWNDARRVVAAKWPEHVESGLLPNQGDFPTKPRIHFYSRKTEETFGFKLKGLEEMAEAIVPQYVELLQKK
ncbi:NAD(P)-binding protein [Apiospora rasikravindrae]|uniref:NAD(P)-binding protein n=1 Tax=Apiospora rasikravindrae TaxID=990691 RepID=A0ABR1TDD1_9PEZI